jgi:predicted transcriptional regulator
MKRPTDSTPPKTSTDSILEGIKRGEQAIKEGKVYTHAQAKEKLKKWLKP